MSLCICGFVLVYFIVSKINGNILKLNIKTSGFSDMGLHPALPEICVVSYFPVSEGGRWTSVSPERQGWKGNCETLWA